MTTKKRDRAEWLAEKKKEIAHKGDPEAQRKDLEESIASAEEQAADRLSTLLDSICQRTSIMGTKFDTVNGFLAAREYWMTVTRDREKYQLVGEPYTPVIPDDYTILKIASQLSTRIANCTHDLRGLDTWDGRECYLDGIDITLPFVMDRNGQEHDIDDTEFAIRLGMIDFLQTIGPEVQRGAAFEKEARDQIAAMRMKLEELEAK